MWLCQRLILTGICARSALFSEGGPVHHITSAKSSSTHKCPWNLSRLVSVRKTSAKLRRDVVKVMNVRLSSTKQNAESSSQSTTMMHLIKWGVATLLITTFVSTTVVWWELWSLKRNMSSVTSTLSSHSAESSEVITMPTFQLYPWQPFYSSQQRNSTDNNDYGVWYPWLQSKSQDPFMLLELCHSKNPTARNMGVRALTAKTAWDDYQYRYVAQAADYRTLIGLSRSPGADPRFFLQQRSLFPSQKPVSEELASLLLSLDQEPTSPNNKRGYRKGSPLLHSRAAVLAHQHLHHHNRPSDDKIRFWGFDGSSLDVASVDGQLPGDQLVLQFLVPVAQLCCNPSHASLFMKGNGLAVLQRIKEQYASTETFTAIANMLGNLALHASFHEAIVQTGWLGLLKKWTADRNSKLAVAAARALTNLDRDWSPEVLDDGVLILHPLHRSRKTVHADMVFVHGLLGGGVKTWRQQDAAYQAAGPGSSRTDCWPKDWLSEDCPHVRMVSVHYDTALSAWSASDTISQEKCTLEGRSRELLEKLRRAGVGKRPIIWVGHSMGGLLIKQMLELCGEQSPLKQQTCGLLLYSIPHHGLSIAALTTQVHFLLYPSTEVQELKADSPHLIRLHKHFKQFVEHNSIPCLSFGEQNKTWLGKTLPKVHLVPPQSSDPGIGEFCTLPLNHISICKPDSRDCDLYQQTLSFVHHCIFFSYVHRLRKGVSGSLD